MARGSRRAARMQSVIANPSRLLHHRINLIMSYRPLPRSPVRVPYLAPITDRRTYHPAPRFRPVTVSGSRHHTLAPGKKFLTPFGVTPIVRFEAPRKIAVCVRRKTRREVLFAQRRTGKGARSPRRRDEWSDVSCK